MAVADVRGHPALLERLGQHLAQAYEGTRPPANPHNLAAPRGFKDEHLRQLHQYQCWVQFELRSVPGALLPPTMRAECARVMVTEAEDNTISVSKLQQDVFIALKTSPLCRDRPAMVQDEYTIPELEGICGPGHRSRRSIRQPMLWPRMGSVLCSPVNAALHR